MRVSFGIVNVTEEAEPVVEILSEGSGDWAVERIEIGKYEIKYNVDHVFRPVVVVSGFKDASNTFAVRESEKDGFVVWTFETKTDADSGQGYEDSPFSFIAISQ